MKKKKQLLIIAAVVLSLLLVATTSFAVYFYLKSAKEERERIAKEKAKRETIFLVGAEDEEIKTTPKKKDYWEKLTTFPYKSAERKEVLDAVRAGLKSGRNIILHTDLKYYPGLKFFVWDMKAKEKYCFTVLDEYKKGYDPVQRYVALLKRKPGKWILMYFSENFYESEASVNTRVDEIIAEFKDVPKEIFASFDEKFIPGLYPRPGNEFLRSIELHILTHNLAREKLIFWILTSEDGKYYKIEYRTRPLDRPSPGYEEFEFVVVDPSGVVIIDAVYPHEEPEVPEFERLIAEHPEIPRELIDASFKTPIHLGSAYMEANELVMAPVDGKIVISPKIGSKTRLSIISALMTLQGYLPESYIKAHSIKVKGNYAYLVYQVYYEGKLWLNVFSAYFAKIPKGNWYLIDVQQIGGPGF